MSLVVDATNYMTRLGDTVPTSSLFSLTFWCKRDTDTGATECPLNLSLTTSDYETRISTADRWVVQGAGYGASAAFGPNPVAVGTWRYLFMTKTTSAPGHHLIVKELSDGDSAFGGSVDLSSGSGLSDVAVNNIYIGAGRPAQGFPFLGKITCVKLWTGVVISDANALTERSTRNITTNTGNIFANWQFNSGALTTDSSANAKTLTPVLSPTYSSEEPTALGSAASPTATIRKRRDLMGYAAMAAPALEAFGRIFARSSAGLMLPQGA